MPGSKRMGKLALVVVAGIMLDFICQISKGTVRKLKIPQNLTSLTYKHVKEYILDGHLKEGDRLTEDFISKQLGISKSPVREALNRLESEGLIQIEPRRGAYIRSFSTKEVADLYDLREALEVHAIETARFSDSLIAELRDSVRRMQAHRAANGRLRYIEEDTRFHALICAATGNGRLSQALEALQNQLRLLRLRTYDLSSSDAVQAHTRIVEALAESNSEEARQLMQQHIRHTCRKLLGHMSRGADNSPVSVRASLQSESPVEVAPGRINS